MPSGMEELQKISKALHSSFELLQREDLSQQSAIENLKVAEQSLNSAINHWLSHNENQGYS